MKAGTGNFYGVPPAGNMLYKLRLIYRQHVQD